MAWNPSFLSSSRKTLSITSWAPLSNIDEDNVERIEKRMARTMEFDVENTDP